MKTNQCDIGLIGLAVMGENLVLNMESKGFQVAVFNRTTAVTEKFAAGRGHGKNIQPTTTMEEFVGALQRPRKAMIMVKAGAPVDSVISQLVPLLEKGDVVIDGGNSLFTDTQRRCRELEGREIHFVGCGVSGGEEVARLVGHYRADLHAHCGTSRWRALLPLHGTGWCRSLCQDGAQRD
jgi:6-phosphogluconate dehydrogenase